MRMQDMESRLDRVIDWVKVCDTKASIMLALIGVFISMIFTSDFVLNTIQSIVNSINDYNFKNASFHDISALGFLVVLSLLLSLYFLMGSVYRFTIVVYSKYKETLAEDSWVFSIFNFLFRHSTIDNKDSDTKKDSMISLNHISGLSLIEFETALNQQNYTQSEEEKDYLSQILINSKRCKEKFEDYNSAIRWMLYSIPFLFLFYIFLLFY